MIVVITDHDCRLGRITVARERIAAGGDAMKAAAGFLFRYQLERPEAPTEITTVAGWADDASYAAYRAGRPAADPKDPAGPFTGIVARRFQVHGIHIGSEPPAK